MKLYVNEAATTSRAVMAFVEAEGIDAEICSVDLMSGEHHQPAYATLNPNRMVPALVDGDFVLTESSAILRYLAAVSGSSAYPSDARERARVDELMAWFDANFYKDFGYSFVYPQLFAHHSRGSAEADRATVNFGRTLANQRLAVLDHHYLGDGRAFLTGDTLTIADYHAASILSLGELIGCSLSAYPRVEAWYRRVCGLDSWTRVNHAFMGFAASLANQSFVGLS